MNEAKYNISGEDLVRDVLLVLRETFEGSPDGEGSIYLDRGIGVLSTLGELSAEQASQRFEGSTIAAHTEHLKFYVDRLVEFIEGRTAPVNWEDSWLIETVNEDEWAALRVCLSNGSTRTSGQRFVRALSVRIGLRPNGLLL